MVIHFSLSFPQPLTPTTAVSPLVNNTRI